MSSDNLLFFNSYTNEIAFLPLCKGAVFLAL